MLPDTLDHGALYSPGTTWTAVFYEARVLAVSTPGRVKKLVVKVPAATLFRHV